MITKKSATKTAPAPAPESRDWKIFFGDGRAPSHEWQERMPEPPPWRLGRRAQPLRFPRNVAKNFAEAELRRAEPFLPSQPMVLAVNTALYLRRPLLLTGTPGTGKSTLISKVAHELQLGPALRWPITSRSNVKAGVYAYDAVGRLQSGRKNSPITEYLTLGPLGTALSATTWPRALLIDEIDKSDLDFANDLLNIIEDGTYDIPELARLPQKTQRVKNAEGATVAIVSGQLVCGQFPFVVMTSNAEREFPPAFLRRCVRLNIDPPKEPQLKEIVDSHLSVYFKTPQQREQIDTLVKKFLELRGDNQELATDQLLNAVFLTVGLNDPERRTFDPGELEKLRETLLRPLTS